jgi:hypothetical protein
MKTGEFTMSPGTDLLISQPPGDDWNINNWMFNQIQSFIKGRILETESGLNTISSFFLENGIAIHLSHSDRYNRDMLRTQFKGNPIVRAVHRIDVHRADFNIVYAELAGFFDTILVLNHMQPSTSEFAFISNAKFLLRKGGNLILLAPVYTTLYNGLGQNWEDWKKYNTSSIRDLFHADFQILKTRYLNLPTGSEPTIFFRNGLSAIVIARKN